MGRRLASATTRPAVADSSLLANYARLMRERHGADLYLFGSRARGTAHADSDYDLAAVAEVFDSQHWLDRVPDRYRIWREAGGFGISLDLHCYTPEEFQRELAGLGYLGQANERGELIKIPEPRAA